MSRLKKFTHSLLSGYLQIATNVIYTLASVPLALHYLSKEQFGLWQVTTAITGYLLLIDFGMTGSVGRILIDYKDNPRGGAYGSVIKIGGIVFLIQGLAIAGAGTALSFWLPQFMNVPPSLQHTLFYLVAGQCSLQGIFFATRIFWNIAAAHQRNDLCNYGQIGTLIAGFVALWLAFHEGFGIYSVLVASAAGSLFGCCCGWTMAIHFKFFPPRGCWGHFDFKLFKEIFFFGGDSFLMAVGFQLTNASQVLIISHTLGLGAAAIWAVATKPVMLAQQFVWRIFAFSGGALSEMVVRGEHGRLLKRFRDIVILSVSSAIFVGGGIALCNQSFLHIWTHGKIAWSPRNDVLLALWFVVDCSTRNHVAAVGLTKNIGRMRYVNFCEGLVFVTAAVLAAPRFGFSGIIISATVANVLCSGIFGVRRTVNYFHVPMREVVNGWMAGPVTYLLLLSAILLVCYFCTESLPPLPRLIVNAAASGGFGLWFFWQFGLNRELRAEAGLVLSKVLKRLRLRA
ncbi:MAG TPA: oligosaccharide flippase family protein [Verrucomicrobiae bacterium]|jgi:O-antigen/teichoic acid export membrane protein|nr:oligosaccharide flippase family protein [Verrucomicrobiae bacterium]